MKKNLKAILVLILVLAFVLSACSTPGQQTTAAPATTAGPSETQAPPAEPKVLRGRLAAEPASLDTQAGQDVNASQVRSLIYDPIIRNHNFEFIPGGAETWEVSADGLVYTFHMRKDAKWSDGQPLTAHDYVYGAIRLIDPTPPAPNGSMAFYGFVLKNGEAFNKGEVTDPTMVGVKALDDYTVEYTLEKPYPYFLDYVSSNLFNPNRKDFTEKYGVEFATSTDKLIGNGPFVLVEWKPEDRFIFEKNENYWNKDAIKLDRIELYVIGDGNTAILMFQNGELDYADIPKDLIPAMDGLGRAIYTTSGTTMWMEFNQDSTSPAAKFLANANFRKAIGHAIDRELFIKAALNDGSIPALSYVPSVMVVNQELWGEKFNNVFYPKTADLVKAEEYLAKALEELGVAREDIPTIKYLTDDRPDRRLMGEIIQDMLFTNLGLDLDITLVQSRQRWDMMTAGDYDIVFAGIASSNPDPIGYLTRLTSENGLNDTRYASAEYDALISASDSEVDPEKRAQLLYEALVLLMEEGPLVPVYNAGGAWAKRDDLINIFKGGIRSPDPNFIFADFAD